MINVASNVYIYYLFTDKPVIGTVWEFTCTILHTYSRRCVIITVTEEQRYYINDGIND